MVDFAEIQSSYAALEALLTEAVQSILQFPNICYFWFSSLIISDCFQNISDGKFWP